MKIRAITDLISRTRFPVDPWRLIETVPNTDTDIENDTGLTDTLFANGNGYLGMRATPSQDDSPSAHGTFVNGFHEKWTIRYPEQAHALATVGQTVINVPDAKAMVVIVDGEALSFADVNRDSYEHVMDFRTGVSHRDVTWSTRTGKRVRVRTERMVCFERRHLAVLTTEITLLDGDAPVTLISQMVNRQDGIADDDVPPAVLGAGADPRKGRQFGGRVLLPQLQRHTDAVDPFGGEMTLGYVCDQSKMTIACAYRHDVTWDGEFSVVSEIDADAATSAFTFAATEGTTIRITKYVAYHTSTDTPVEQLASDCHRTIEDARVVGLAQLKAEQSNRLAAFWQDCDVEVVGDAAAQQSIRWNLFQLAQASACATGHGIAAKGVTASGYDGHYFWDTEVYVVPFLAYSNPAAARDLLHFRYSLLDAARARAAEMSQKGALYPWRTISGEEASAYYPAGTAQYHINAAVAFAIERYFHATNDLDFLASEGAEMLVEMARLYEDLGFYADDDQAGGKGSFHIHSVTGPDEYTAVVNDNFYTNVMAGFTMRFAADVVELLQKERPDAAAALQRRAALSDTEAARWRHAADSMYLPVDERRGINPQDINFLDREPWDFAGTPDDKYPLLLHFHPLVIYRFQVLKQADVVLAMFLRRSEFSRDQRRRNFDYYDPLTTGDSSLSACVQSVVAADVGHDDLAWEYFCQALYLDIANTHGNTADGVHIANAGGVWAGLIYGFGGFDDDGSAISLTPHLPAAWQSLRFNLVRRGVLLTVTIEREGGSVTTTITNRGDSPVPFVDASGTTHQVTPGGKLTR